MNTPNDRFKELVNSYISALEKCTDDPTVEGLSACESAYGSLQSHVSELELDRKRLERVMHENFDVWKTEDGQWTLVDFRRDSLKSTYHPNFRQAIDAAIQNEKP